MMVMIGPVTCLHENNDEMEGGAGFSLLQSMTCQAPLPHLPVPR